ncbi:MAG: STAS domain-containing protein [Bacteroidota bacterium]|nr:STAS domain-containing protein [Bacteroidota bacterium]
MNFSVTKENDLIIFRLAERHLDAANTPTFKAELLLLSQEDVHVLVVDLRGVEFCDSCALSALLLAERQMRAKDGGVLVVDDLGKIRSLISLAKLDGVIPVFSTLEEARAALEED